MAPSLLLLPLSLLLLPLGAGAASPVIIVPGDGSNQLEARLDKPSTVSWRCEKKADWFRLWLDTANLLLATDCWADNVRVAYDEERDELSNAPGVETRVPYWGSTEAMEELDPGLPLHASGVFRKMVQSMEAAGLQKNKTLRGAPYDFRFAPSSRQGARFTADLKQLIEETSHATGSRVSLVSHSMGCLQVLYLLNHQTQEWKDRYVEKWIPLAGPYGGSAKEMLLHASGDASGVPGVSSLAIRAEQRSYETNFWLAPVPRWFGDRVLVTTPTRNYSAQDYDAFFEDVGFPTGKKLIRRIADVTSAVDAPGVDVVCMYSLGVATPDRYEYDEAGFDKHPQTANGDGDGTVNALSLRLCERWAQSGAQSRSAKVVPFSKVTHQGMLTDDGVLKVLLKELGLSGEREMPVVV